MVERIGVYNREGSCVLFLFLCRIGVFFVERFRK